MLAIPPAPSPPLEAEEEGDLRHRLRRRTRLAFAFVALLLLGLFGLAAILQVGGAVIGPGEVTVESRVKTITHESGGILTSLSVHEGDRVVEGQELMRFDTSVSGVGSAEASDTLARLLARGARLKAESDGSQTIVFPTELADRTDPAALELMARVRRLFDLRRQERDGVRALLSDRIEQYQQQVASYQAQIASVDEQLKLVEPELEGLRALYAKQYVTISRMNATERLASQLRGSRAALIANVAEARARISETREQMLNVDKTRRSEAADDLSRVLTDISNQQVRTASAADTFTRSVIRAPQAGTIDKLAYTTIGSAIPAGQPILQIVPDKDELVVTARIRPQDVDEVRVGQSVRVAFSGLNRQLTPDVSGKLVFVSPDIAQDQATGAGYYRIRVRLDPAELARNHELRLKAGMPAEVFVNTGNRSILSFLVKPLLDQLSYAFREN